MKVKHSTNAVLIVVFLPGVSCTDEYFSGFIIIAYVVWLACFIAMLLLFFKYCYDFIKRRMYSSEDIPLTINSPTYTDHHGEPFCPPDGRFSSVTPPPSYAQSIILPQRGMLRSYGTMPTRFHAPVTIPVAPSSQPTHGNSPPPDYEELFPRVNRTNRSSVTKTRT